MLRRLLLGLLCSVVFCGSVSWSEANQRGSDLADVSANVPY